MSGRSAAEVWCWAPIGRDGRPHRLLIGRLYLDAGRIELQLTGRAQTRPSDRPGVLEVGCPKHGFADVDLEIAAAGAAATRGKPHSIRLHRHTV